MLKLHAKRKIRIGGQFTGLNIRQLLKKHFLRRPGSMCIGFNLHFQALRQRAWLNLKQKRHLVALENLFRYFRGSMKSHAGNRNIWRIAYVRNLALPCWNFNRVSNVVPDICIFPVEEFQIRILFNLLVINCPATSTAPVFARHMRQQTAVRRLFH